MNEFKGTPAPWMLEENDRTYGMSVRDSDRNVICVPTDQKPQTEQESYANATLISSAPELLECLKECLSEIEDRCVDSSFDPDTYPIVIKTKALINKALGV